MADATDVAIVGGGPAGAALAIQLAKRDIHAVLIERQVEPGWRASGVFSSPLTHGRLTDLGLSPAQVDRLARPIAALDLETLTGARCRISYEHGHALGLSRPAFDQAILERARVAGAEVRMGTVVRSVELGRGANTSSVVHMSSVDEAAAPARSDLTARIVVGADGSGTVARPAGVNRTPRWLRKTGITFHKHDESAVAEGVPMSGRFLFGNGWYVGVAPVPGGLVNVGIVAGAEALADGPEGLASGLLAQFPHPQPAWVNAPTADGVRTLGTLRRSVDRVAGEGWLLVGDACGFIDPLTGEGINRAMSTAALAADAIQKTLCGDRAAMRDYDRRVRATFRSKNIVSWVLQAFLSRPGAFDYALRHLAARTSQRETFTLVMTDQAAASRALDPRFLFRLLRP